MSLDNFSVLLILRSKIFIKLVLIMALAGNIP